MERGVNNLISVSTCRDREGTLTRLESARILRHLCMSKKQTKCPLDNCYSLAGGKNEQEPHHTSHVGRSNYVSGFRLKCL